MPELTLDQKLSLLADNLISYAAQNQRAMQDICHENQRAMIENADFRRTSILSQQASSDKLDRLSEELTQFILQSRQSNVKLEKSIAEMQLWRAELHDAVIGVEAVCAKILLTQENK